MWDRRTLIRGLAVAMVGWGLGPADARADATLEILYFGVGSIDEALDHLTQMVPLLGPDVSKKLRLVGLAKGRFGVIYDRPGTDRDAAARVAKRHGELLERFYGHDEVTVSVVNASEVETLHHISYGIDASLEASVERFNQVSRMLGTGVLRDLVVEEVSGGYRTVYQRFGAKARNEEVAKHHATLLKSLNIGATSVDAGMHRIVHSAASTGVAQDALVKDAANKPAVVSAQPTVLGSGEISLPVVMAGSLRDEINDHVQGLRKKGTLGTEQTSWYVYDLEKDEPLVAINAEQQRQTASMVKPFVALAVLHKAAKGNLIYGPKTTAKMERMIQASDNEATNWCMKAVGGPAEVQKILSSHYGKILPDTKIIEYIPTNGRTYRNLAAATDYIRFLRALWRDELPESDELKRLMNLPGRDRLYDGAPDIPVGTAVYNKTGSTAKLCGDMGILVARTASGDSHAYAIVGIIERSTRVSRYGSWISRQSDVIRSVSNLVYKHLKKEHGFV